MPPEPAVLHRDEHLLVLEKPAGLPTTTPPGGRECLVDLARRIDPYAPRLHPSSRLDAEVSGVVIFARTEQATRALLAARKAGRYVRRYVALASGAPSPPAGEWGVPIALDPRDKRRRIAGDGRGAREARTAYETVAVVDGAALLSLFPQTGRTHQLRVHAAHAGVPLLGDTLYGGPKRIVRPDGRVVTPRRVMLHCAEVTIPDPARATPTLTFQSPLPLDLRQIWRDLGGREPVSPA